MAEGALEHGRWRQSLVGADAGQEAPTLTSSDLCRWMQRAAGAHAEALGLGFEALCARGLTWMLSRFRVEVRRIPTSLAPLNVTTWPSGVQRLLARREFVIDEPSDERAPFAVATSGWLLVDSKSRRPVRPGPFVEHLSLDQHVLDLPGKRLAAPESTGWKHTCAVRQEDIDFNGHVTNTRYLTWIEEALLRKAGFEGLLSHLEIDFVSEVLAGEHVSVGASREGSQDAWSVLMVREEDGATVAVARVRA